MTHTTLLRITTGAAAIALAAGAVALPGQAALAASTLAAGTHSSTSAVTVADLADDSPTQQRWLSEPDSRIALNPSHSQTDDTRPKRNNALDTVFYADQNKKTADNVVRNSFTNGTTPSTAAPAYDEGDASPLLSDNFGAGDEQNWPTAAGTGNGATLVVGGAGGTVTLPAGTEWGSVGRTVTMDVDTDPILVVSVAATTGKWALKITPNGAGDIKVQDDTTAVGTFAYDLHSLGVPSGKATIKLFASGSGSATFRALSIHARPGFTDDFTDLGPWSTNVQSNNGATIAPAASGLGATVTSTSSSNFGAVARPITVDLTANPVLTVAVGPLSAGSQWALKLTGADGYGDFATVQNDTPATGIFNYNLAALTGRTGQQTFGVKLFSTKSPTPTSATFTRLSMHGSQDWTQSPTGYSNTWNPQSLDWTGTFGEAGSYSTRDVFVDDNTVSRLIQPTALTSGNPTLTGNFSGTVGWDSARRVLTSASDGYTRAVGFPVGAQVLFYDNAGAAAQGAGGATSPASSSTTWLAMLPRDHDTAIGLGYAYGSATAAQNAAAASAARGADAGAVTAALATRTAEWNAYLAKVPAVGDYELHAVAAEGTTPESIRAMYYRAFVDLKQTVVPPQPESGISHYQVATGKAATYNGGSARNRASASWDSLLGIQYLGYTEPDLAWDSLIGMMADVQPDGGLNGESLPSRKAQTAWMLYSITGDKAKLAEVYPAIKAHMGWSSDHLAWNIDSHFPGGGVPASDERDAEFVNSLVVDLDYAADSARVLGKNSDAQSFQTLQQSLVSQYKSWFFMPDGRAVQYYWTSKPDATYDQRKGTVNYVDTGLHMPGLDATEVQSMMARFDAEFDPNAQFAGTASDAVKAPDAQFVAYGLLEHGQTAKAQIYLETILRDVTRTHAFSEVYQAGSNGAEPISRGESPTTFGMAQVIDNLWIMNGYRSDEGTPTFVRLPGATGGVSGLTYLGQGLDAHIDGNAIALSGAATQATGVCTQVDAALGASIPLSTTCGDLSASTETAKAGEKVTLSGSKFPAGGSLTVTLHSDPVTLATITTGADGSFRATVTIPANTPAGAHTLVAAAGDVTASVALTVTAAANGGAGNNGSNGGPSTGDAATGGTTTSAGGVLASTGSDLAIPIVVAFLALLVGAGAIGLARRRAAHLRETVE